MVYRQVARDALSNGREALAMCQAYEDRIAELAGHLAEVDNCRHAGAAPRVADPASRT